MKRLKTVCGILTITLFVALVVEGVYFTFLPNCAFDLNWALPLFFAVFYLAASLFVKPQITNAQIAKYFIGLKAVKMLFTLVFITLAILLLRENVIVVVIKFLVYYILFLVAESIFCIKIKESIKK